MNIWRYKVKRPLLAGLLLLILVNLVAFYFLREKAEDSNNFEQNEFINLRRNFLLLKLPMRLMLGTVMDSQTSLLIPVSVFNAQGKLVFTKGWMLFGDINEGSDFEGEYRIWLPAVEVKTVFVSDPSQIINDRWYVLPYHEQRHQEGNKNERDSYEIRL